MFGVLTEGFCPLAPTKSVRNWSEQIISTFGRRAGAATAAACAADECIPSIALLAAVILLMKSRLEFMFY